MMGHLLRLIGLFALTMALLAPAAPVMAAPVAPPSALAAAVRDQYIVTLKAGVSARAFTQANRIATRAVYDTALNGFTARLNQRQLAALKRNPVVLRIEADQVLQAPQRALGGGASIQALPWNLDRIDQQYLPLDGTYTTLSKGLTANVYVIDTGIRTTLTEFSGRAFVAYDAFGGNGQDCNGSGTFLAGLVGGTNYGVAKKARLWSVRAFDCNGAATTAGLIGAINWVTANHFPKAIAVMGFGGISSATLNSAISTMIAGDVSTAVAAASGNSCASAPGNIATALTAAAASASSAPTSTYGSCIDIFAPGISVSGPSLNGGVVTRSGAALAAAHVAGVAALFKDTYGDQPSATVHSWIVSTATTGALTPPLPTGAPDRYLYTAGL